MQATRRAPYDRLWALCARGCSARGRPCEVYRQDKAHAEVPLGALPDLRALPVSVRSEAAERRDVVFAVTAVARGQCVRTWKQLERAGGRSFVLSVAPVGGRQRQTKRDDRASAHSETFGRQALARPSGSRSTTGPEASRFPRQRR